MRSATLVVATVAVLASSSFAAPQRMTAAFTDALTMYDLGEHDTVIDGFAAIDGLDLTVEPVTRPASASPSVGTVKRHVEEQKTLMDAAFESPTGRGTDY